MHLAVGCYLNKIFYPKHSRGNNVGILDFIFHFFFLFISPHSCVIFGSVVILVSVTTFFNLRAEGSKFVSIDIFLAFLNTIHINGLTY